MLDRAIQHGRGELEVDDILAGVETSKTGILAQEEGNVLELLFAFEIIVYPRRSVMNVIAAAGRNGMAGWSHYSLFDTIAKEMGATVVRCFCRPSVARYIKRRFPDTQEAYVVMEREVA